MKVLFVCSGNSKFGISPIIRNQADSLLFEGVHVEIFTIKGRGIKGYISNILPLRRYLKSQNYDIVHAHYSLTAFVASLAGAKSLVVSLMGSDVKAAKWFKLIIRFFYKMFSWKVIIVKSEDMYNDLNIRSAEIIPNGVDTFKFAPRDTETCKKQLSWGTSKKHILFPANPNRYEKNFKLAETAVLALEDESIELHYFENIPNDQTPIWYNAADVVLMTSLWEGSPNAIKEAVACCRPIVTTNVGDVSITLKDLAGTFVTDFEDKNVINSLREAMTYKCIDGLEQIKRLSLASNIIAKKIIKLYDSNNKR